MKKKEITLVKLGGSCFSDKNTPRSLLENVIDEVCKHVKQCGVDVVIVHGGGSYGHPLAKAYKIHEGRKREVNNQATGFILTHQAMIELNTIIMQKFLDHGLEIYPVQPSAIFLNKNGSIHEGWTRSIDALIDEGFIPILHGDTVIDVLQGWGILSGDTIMVHLANNLSHDVKKLVYLLDVDGLYDKDPKVHHDASLIPEVVIKGENITFQGIKGLDAGLMASCTSKEIIDVTGGIMKKLGELTKIEKQGIEAFFLNGRNPDALEKIFTNKLPRCTKITIMPRT